MGGAQSRAKAKKLNNSCVDNVHLKSNGRQGDGDVGISVNRSMYVCICVCVSVCFDMFYVM